MGGNRMLKGRGKVIPGFYITDFNLSIDPSTYSDMIVESLSIDGWNVGRRTFNHFLNDKTLYEDEECVLVLEGVILNKTELFDQYGVTTIEKLVEAMYSKKGERFFADFRGSFSGALYDKNISQWVIWTNHYGDNALFYFQSHGHIAIGSYYIDLANSFKSFGALHVDEHAVASMQSTGFMSDDSTYALEIKRLLPGHYIRIADMRVEIEQYWRVRHDVYDFTNSSEDEIIELIDQYFRRAVRREFEKDREYGYRHLAELSGGLDSRMVSWVAHELGYTDVLDITFSQANYLDELIAKQIATALHNQCMAMPLDDAGFLFDLDKITCLNFGLTLAFGTTGAFRFFDALDISKYGIIHTGAVGDAVLGSFLSNPDEQHQLREAGRYTRLMDDDPASHCDLSRFADQEDYLMSTRAFLGAATSHLVTRGFSDIGSPFLDIDFFDLCMSIPLEYRCGHKIYKAWILKKYPKAADFIWEKYGMRIDAPDALIRIHQFARAVKNAGPAGVFFRVCTLLGIKTKRSKRSVITTGMNPLDAWLDQRPEIVKYWNSYFASNLDSLPLSEERKDSLCEEYRTGAATEKILALTVLAGIKLVKS